MLTSGVDLRCCGCLFQHRIDAALSSSSLVDVNDLLGCSLVKKLAKVRKLNLSIIEILGCNGVSQFLDGSLQARFRSAIARPTL